jgi:predicted homoserine dehydrogenase-like protein
MGPGPDYLFQRPYHLGCFEVPLTVVEAVLYREPALAPRGAPLAEVIAIAKRDLKAGEILDGIGGETVYGQIERAAESVEFLPIGLSDGLRLSTSVSKGDPIPGSAVDVDGSQYMANLRHLQAMLFPASEPTTSHALPAFC